MHESTKHKDGDTPPGLQGCSPTGLGQVFNHTDERDAYSDQIIGSFFELSKAFAYFSELKPNI